MTTPIAVVAAVLAVAGLTQEPTFRARTEAVRLDVLVTRDGVPVSGLTADDFEVRDNGVRQKVTALRALESVQLGLVLDASGSMSGERIALVRAATAELIAQLEAHDTVAIVAFGDQVGSLARRASPGQLDPRSLDRLRAAGNTALIDGIYAGILEAASAGGPTLLLVMTDGRNNASWLQGVHVLDAARRTETAIYPVAVGVDQAWRGTRERFRTSDAMALLHVLAESTGGRAIAADWDASLASAFRAVLDEFRQRYILSFTPEGVATGGGWHTLEVRVKRRGLTVRSRDGYWSD